MPLPTIVKDIFLSILFFSIVIILCFYSAKSIQFGPDLFIFVFFSVFVAFFKFASFIFPSGKERVISLLTIAISELIFLIVIFFIVVILHLINQADNGINFIFFLILITIEILLLFNHLERFTLIRSMGYFVNLCVALALLFGTLILNMGPNFTFQFLFEVTTAILTIVTILSYGTERCVQEVRLTIEHIIEQQREILYLKIARFHWVALEITVIFLLFFGIQSLFSWVISVRSSDEISAWIFFISSMILILFVMILMPGVLVCFFRLMNPFFSASKHERENWHEISAFPQLFCPKYAVKPKLKKRSPTFVYYQGVPCRGDDGCTTKLLAGIKKVTGMIAGPEVEDYREGDQYFINLWYEGLKKARNADIDQLEIRESKLIKNYDLAISSVTKELIDDLSRPREFFTKIPLIIQGTPSISEGVRKKLRTEFAEPL